MADPGQLPHLIALLDDDSPVVRQALTRELDAFGETLPELLESLSRPLRDTERSALRLLLVEGQRRRLRQRWPMWSEPVRDVEKLEVGLSLLADFLGGGLQSASLSPLLEELASGCRAWTEETDPRSLSAYLFHERGLHGDEDTFVHPDNSNLVAVIESGRGIPISLCCIYMLVGQRLGLDITGCNFPGHFLARARSEDGAVSFVDCFHGGRFLDRDTLLEANPGSRTTIAAILDNTIQSGTILIRVLNNLTRAYEATQATADRELMQELSRQVEATERRAVGPAETGPRFEVGQLVRHRRYGYRGVIVARDEVCRADESWYRSNSTQPDRNQAWYSVLVDGSEQITYAAESSLLPDASRDPVSHPLVDEFFTRDGAGAYRRNDRPWPGW